MGYGRGMDSKAGWGAYLTLWVFGLAFGLMEAAVVVYLRQIGGIAAGQLFPVLQNLDPAQDLAFSIERLREGASLVVMAGPAFLFSSRAFERLLGYGLVFGVWDLSYYGFLWLFVEWPQSLFAYDVLFLIPTLWVAPVLCPILISLSLVFFVSAYLFVGARRMARNPSLLQWLLALLGAALVQLSFMNQADYYLNGGMPPRFSWLVFAGGYGLAALAAVLFLLQFTRQPRTRFF
jgi:hypothetical protein